MRVMHINLARGWRGGERQTLLLMQGLRVHGVESILVARAGQPLARHAAADGFAVYPPRAIWRIHADLAHAHEARGLQWAAAWKLLHGRPLVATRRVVFRPGRGMLTRLKYRAADRLIAISQGVARVMTEWGTPPARIRIVHSAVATADQSSPDRAAAIRARFPGKRIVGCIGALTPEKNHAALLRAAGHVLRTRPEVVFLILGDGPLRASLEAQASAIGGPAIVFEGFQSDPYSYLRAFDVLALTSREEGLGTSILDAFAYGVPVVATRAGGIPELVVDHVSGLLCPVGDDAAIAHAILALLDDAALGHRLRTGARQRLLEDFTLERMAAGYHAIYSELLGVAAAAHEGDRP